MRRLILRAFVLQLALVSAASAQVDLLSTADGAQLRLESGLVLRTTDAAVLELRAFRVPGSDAVGAAWYEARAGADKVPYYAISLDGRTLAVLRETSYELLFRRGAFDPAQGAPDFSGSAFEAGGNVHVVQYLTQPLLEYSRTIRALGGEVFDFLEHHAHLVRMSPEVRARVAELPFVRWVGPLHPELRVDPEILMRLDPASPGPARYNVQVFERGPAEQSAVAEAIVALGGTIDFLSAEGFRFEATMTSAVLARIAGRDEVRFIDAWGPDGADLDIVRVLGGANYLETVGGFSGSGVNVEVMDVGTEYTHPDLANHIVHGSVSFGSHGTCTSGIVSGSGAGNPLARGVMPLSRLVVAQSSSFVGGSRYTHTARLVNPALPYQCVLQSNSWGGSLTTSYTTTSAEMDDIIAINDFVICQSQSNAGSTSSRPQAWAKNIVAVGGINHGNNSSYSDDSWGGASIGPAADGRIKPDLAFFYDGILCTDQVGSAGYSSGNYNSSFCCTSAATPTVAGHFGLFFEMWRAGVFGNAPGAGTVFEARPRFTLAKAAMINTARQWTFSGTGHNLTRTHQGWGHPHLGTLWDRRTKTFFVNQTDPVANLGTVTYNLDVSPGEPDLRVTLVYRDAMGTVSSSQHRKNDLTLVVTDPAGTVYYGNNGLSAGNWSTSGGTANTKDTVENVMIQNPMPGGWIVRVRGDNVNTDPVTNAPSSVADFALWVTGVTVGVPCPAPQNVCSTAPNSVGPGARIGWYGSQVRSVNNFNLLTLDCPPGTTGIYYYGQNQTFTPFGNGFRCIGSPTVRLGAIVTNSFGDATYTLDLNGTAIVAGATWYFQFWYRNPAGGGAGFNLSDALQITFCGG